MKTERSLPNIWGSFRESRSRTSISSPQNKRTPLEQSFMHDLSAWDSKLTLATSKNCDLPDRLRPIQRTGWNVVRKCAWMPRSDVLNIAFPNAGRWSTNGERTKKAAPSCQGKIRMAPSSRALRTIRFLRNTFLIKDHWVPTALAVNQPADRNPQVWA